MVEYRKKVLIAPSILAADFSSLGDEVCSVEAAGADWLHIDVMDGHFVPNITIGPGVVKSLRKKTDIFFDVHLMISEPDRYIDDFVNAGSDMITFHVESIEQPEKLISKIKKSGIKAGLSLKPGTPVEEVLPFLDIVDMVLVMTVEPGFGGQEFIVDMLEKISSLKEKFSGHLQVDGGINSETSRKVREAGADVLVAGSAIFGKDDYKKAILDLKS